MLYCRVRTTSNDFASGFCVYCAGFTGVLLDVVSRSSLRRCNVIITYSETIVIATMMLIEHKNDDHPECNGCAHFKDAFMLKSYCGFWCRHIFHVLNGFMF